MATVPQTKLVWFSVLITAEDSKEDKREMKALARKLGGLKPSIVGEPRKKKFQECIDELNTGRIPTDFPGTSFPIRNDSFPEVVGILKDTIKRGLVEKILVSDPRDESAGEPQEHELRSWNLD